MLGSSSKIFHLHIIIDETQQRTIIIRKYNYDNMDKAMCLGWGKVFFYVYVRPRDANARA